MTKTIRENFHIKNIIQLIILTVCFIIGSRVVFSNEIKPRMEDVYTQDCVPYTEDTERFLLKEGNVYTEDVIFPTDRMLGIGVELYSDTSDNEGTLLLELYDEAGTLLGTETLDVSEIVNMEKNLPTLEDVYYFNVSFPELSYGHAGEPMTLVLTVQELSSDTKLYAYGNKTKDSAHPDGFECVVRAYCYHYDYWYRIYQLFSILLYIVLVVSYFLLFAFRADWHKVFLPVGIGFILVYNFLIPPVTVPDELNHIATAAYYSNAILSYGEPEFDDLTEAAIYVRQTEGRALPEFKPGPDLREYEYLKQNLGRRTDAEGEALVELQQYKESDNFLLYLPGILGITLGRLLHLNGVSTFYLGRLFIAAFYVLWFFFVIKRAPFGKAAVFLFSFCPMVLQMCCSFSYDAVPIEAGSLFFMVLCDILYRKKKLDKKDTVLLCFLLFVLSGCKGGVYIPLCLLVLVLPTAVFGSVKRRRIFRLIFAAAAAAGFLTCTFAYLLQVLGVTEAMTTTQLYADSLQPYSISDVLTHPVHSTWVVINTLLMYADFYLKGMYVGPLGWLNIEINPFWGYGLLALMILGVLPVGNEAGQITKRQRLCFFLMWLLIFLMALASMFVSWTTAGNLTVSGLQGRYFTPVFLLMLFFTARGDVLVLRKDISREVSFVGVALGLVIINNILSSTQTLW